MANHKSAEKRARQRTKRNLRNKQVAGALRTAVKKARAAVDAKKPDLGTTVHFATSLVDKAVTKGVMHKKTAARLVSRLAKRANKAT